MRRNLIYTLVALLCQGSILAQQPTVLQIRNTQQMPVQDAALYIRCTLPDGKEKRMVAYSGEDGKYTFSAQGTIHLWVQMLGYEGQDTLLPAGGVHTITLKAYQNQLAGVLVTGQLGSSYTDKSVLTARIINQSRIEKQGAVSLKDVLGNELNVRVSNDGVLGSGMSLQGLGGQNVKILIDGVPVVGRLNGQIDLSQLNLANVERIELIQGPMSVNYGTDALGGVINIITKKPLAKTLGAGINTLYESAGTYNFDAFIQQSGARGGYRVAGGRYFFEGIGTGNGSRVMLFKPKEQYFADISVRYNWKKLQNRVQAAWYNEYLLNRGTAVITPYQAYGFDDHFYTTRYNIGLFNDYRFNSNAKLELINSWSAFNRVKNTYRKDLVSLESQLTPNPSDQDTTTFGQFTSRATYSKNSPDKRLNYQAGYDINYEEGTGKRIAGNKQSIADFAFFMASEIKLFKKGNWLFRPGLRASYNTRFGTPLVPSVALKGDFAKRWSLRASYARGFRAPSLKEMNLFFVDVNHNVQGNPNLKAEKSHALQASLCWNLQRSTYIVKVEPAVFYNYLYDMITLAAVDLNTQLYQYQNLERFSSTGFNLSADLKSKQLEISAGYAYNGRNTYLGNQGFFFAHEGRLNCSYTIPRIKLTPSVFLRTYGKQGGVAVGTGGELVNTFLDPYTMLDLTVQRQFWKERCSITAGIKNLANVSAVASNVPGGVHGSGGGSLLAGMGRYYFAQLKFNIQNTKK